MGGRQIEDHEIRAALRPALDRASRDTNIFQTVLNELLATFRSPASGS
jgi:hypothetical protein